MPFDTCSAQAPCPEQTSPLSRPTGQAMAVVMSNAALSLRRLPMALGLPDGVCRSGGLLLVTLWLLPAIDASVPGRRAAPQADTFARAPARNQDAGSRLPSLAGRRGDLSTKRDAHRRIPLKSSNQPLCRACNQIAAKPRGPGTTSPRRAARHCFHNDLSILRRGGPPRAAKAHLQAALQTA